MTTTTTKKKTTTTTKKKTTTTTTTAKKQEITTTTSPAIKITQSDVDKLVKELQIYADEIFENKSGYSPYDTEWVVQIGDGYWGTYEEHLVAKTPSNSSWNSPYSWAEYQNPENYSFSTYEIQLDYMKEKIDWTYEWSPNCHIVVYVEYVVNEKTGYTGWDIYLLR